MLVDAAILKEYEALVRSKNWSDLYSLFENDRTDIREDHSLKRIITLETVPLFVYISFVVPQRDRRDHRKVFSTFDDESLVNNYDDFMSSKSLTNYFGTCYIQELMERGENMNEVIIKVLENNSFLRSRRHIALKAVQVSRGGSNNILYHLIRIRMAKEIERKGVSLERCAHLKVWPSLISQVDSKDAKRICFREFFKLLKGSYPSLLERPDIVKSMGLVDSAIHYGKEDALRYLFTRCHGLLLNNSASIFRSIAEMKCSVSLALALGIGASVQDLEHYPTNVKVLLDVDRTGLCPLHLLWMMPSVQRRLKIDTNRCSSRDKSMETILVERTLMCIRVCEQKFPQILHHFGRAWTHVSLYSKPISGRNKQSFPVQQPYSLGMMRRIIHTIALSQGRKPLHVSCEYGFSWDKGIRVFYNEDESLIYTSDPLTNLKPFALAACSDESDLDSIYELLVRHPDAIGV